MKLLNFTPKNSKPLSKALVTKVGVVIPTLARNVQQLESAIESALNNHCVSLVVLITPFSSSEKMIGISASDKIKVIYDEQPGFTFAMNLGVSFLKEHEFEYLCGIGDDDVIAPGFLDSIIVKMIEKKAVVGLGHCFYLDNSNKVIFRNTVPLFLLKFLHLTPNLIPAPGALIKLETWNLVGGLNDQFKYVADFDLWLKLRKYGKFVKLNIPMSYFRWHDLSLTAGNRSASRKEALLAQFQHIPRHQRILFYTFTKIAYRLGDASMKRSMKKSFKPIT